MIGARPAPLARPEASARPAPLARLGATATIASCLALLVASCGGSKAASTAGDSAARGSSVATGAGSTRTTSTAASTSSHELAGNVVSASAGALTATLHAAGHRPRVGARWPIRFTVLQAGKPARAAVAYEYLFGGQVVAHRSHYRFTGSFHDVFQWPASAVGFPLTFRAVISSGGATLDLDYPVQVER